MKRLILITIAKDVKIQVEFNPQRVSAYRLIGYENRILNPEDFNDDKKDAGEIGAGHTVTALYEIVPPGHGSLPSGVDDLKYQEERQTTRDAASNELLTLKLRYKPPERDESKLMTVVVQDNPKPLESASQDFQFACAVAQFGMLLRQSPYRADCSFTAAHAMARKNVGPDPFGYRAEFATLVRLADEIGPGNVEARAQTGRRLP